MTNKKYSIAIACAMTMLAMPMLATAAGAQVTSGDVMLTDEGALRYGEGMVSGHASMVRVPSGKTVVDIQVKGLMAGATYPTHVHNQPCSTGGGGHYQHEVGGAVDAVNEIWLTFTPNEAGNASADAKHAHYARPDAQSIVIHDYSDKARIACIDFE